MERARRNCVNHAGFDQLNAWEHLSQSLSKRPVNQQGLGEVRLSTFINVRTACYKRLWLF